MNIKKYLKPPPRSSFRSVFCFWPSIQWQQIYLSPAFQVSNQNSTTSWTSRPTTKTYENLGVGPPYSHFFTLNGEFMFYEGFLSRYFFVFEMLQIRDGFYPPWNNQSKMCKRKPGEEPFSSLPSNKTSNKKTPWKLMAWQFCCPFLG